MAAFVKFTTQLSRFALLGALLCVMLFASGCGNKQDTIVLLPDLDGGVGAIVVKGAEKEVLVDKPNVAVSVDSKKRPSEAYTMSEAKLRKEFGAALDAAPIPPARFLLYFKSGSTKLTAESKKLLPEIIAEIRKRKSTDVSVVGHADRTGKKSWNMTLSTRRAKAVAKLLRQGGVEDCSFEVTSHGEENPLIPTADNVPEPRNRRVAVTVR